MFTPDGFVSELRAMGVTHVVGVPDSTLGEWFPAVARSSDVTLVSVCREGEAWAVAGGLWVGGAAPVVLQLEHEVRRQAQRLALARCLDHEQRRAIAAALPPVGDPTLHRLLPGDASAPPRPTSPRRVQRTIARFARRGRACRPM